ncbi:MAG: hypothetical protein COV57_00540 [Candidatus Liptonbacteria bacterium CG11_big_fil_rev_8_21_14_0_20_35_14]|uniref:ABC transporter ATP-binding protein n=1 Tax=Candidatus Liptonbacteria bacterium CG11_big_fil_rev_8_21_14_0_20_35_14 TaxID=1974634 RepID=A0A2H0NAP3_9BACT|nr:MAG: hypothetical protein COV57_00540 [Candidatus Liptonbacteria bacterium CG11_big_fil_rev_8_21_14_0_20_35_14]
MNTDLKTKIYYLKKALIYVKNYKRLGILIIGFSVLASIFDGISIGALIPILQGLSDQTNTDNIENLFPFFTKIKSYIFKNSKEDTLIILLIFALIMIILKNTFAYLNNITIQKTSSLIKKDLIRNIFTAITEADFKYHHSLRSGDIINSIMYYSKGIVAFVFTFLTLGIKTSKIAIYLALLFLISWKLTLVAIIAEILLFPIIRLILNKIKNINITISRELDGLSNQLFETLNSIPLIKISSTEDKEQNKFNNIANNLANLEYKEIKFVRLTPLATEIIILTTIIIIFITTIKIGQIDIISLLPFIIAYLYIFLRLFQEANGFITAVSGMFQNIIPFRIYEDRLNHAKNQAEVINKTIIEKLEDKIEFNKVYFEYSLSKPIIENIDFKIPKGSFTAIIGPTGVGKTTIINLIAGLLTPTSGDITIDSKNINKINRRKWRQKIGFISQDSILFNESFAYNISYGSPHKSKDDITKAAKISNIHSFIMSLPNKYETIVGERGAKLSGGQKQRIAIARAIIKDPDILILDEATSALDTKTEKDVQEALEKAMESRTVIAIAHRLSTIKKADNIIVLDKGKIVEQGNHKELICKDGTYKKYYELQYKS